MQYVLSPKTFTVEELFRPALSATGRYYYYLLEKKGVSHSKATQQIKVRAWFNGIKDKNATTTQWMCTTEQLELENQLNLELTFKGYSNERLHIGGHKGNRFTVQAHLTSHEFSALKKFKASHEYVANYFGKQRFTKNTLQIITHLANAEYETALKIFLTHASKFDTQKSSAMKQCILTQWGNWKAIKEDPLITGTGKVVVFEYLEKNSQNFEKAFLVTEPKSTRILIKAAQAKRFNDALNVLLHKKKPNTLKGIITEHEVALSASKAVTRKLCITPTLFEQHFRKNSLERKTFFNANKFKVTSLQKGEYKLSFELPRGAYATVFLVFLENWLKNKINKEKSLN